MTSVERTLAVVQLFGLRLGLRLRLGRHPLDGLLQLLARGPVGGRLVTPALDELERAMQRAERAVERVPGVGKSCLYQSLGRFGLLRSWGFRPVFLMGVDPRDPEQAHAWLELDGVPYNEQRAEQFVVSFRFPSGASTRC